MSTAASQLDIVRGLVRAQKQIDFAAEQSRAALQLETNKLLHAYTPVVHNAVREYNNKRVGYSIVMNTQYGFTIDTDNSTICFELCLHDGRGAEPDEDLEPRELEAVTNKFSTILNRHLKSAGIPLKSGTMTVPISYYPR